MSTPAGPHRGSLRGRGPRQRRRWIVGALGGIVSAVACGPKTGVSPIVATPIVVTPSEALPEAVDPHRDERLARSQRLVALWTDAARPCAALSGEAEIYACACRAACGVRVDPSPDGGVTTLRYPFREIDGLALVIAADGTVSRCDYTRMGAPEVAVAVDCGVAP